MKKIKLIIIGIITITAIILLWQYINGFLGKTRATVEKVNISYSSETIKVAKNGNFNVGVILSAENNKKISAVDLKFLYDEIESGASSLIDYVSVQTIPANYFGEKIVEATSAGNLVKNLRLVLAAKKAEASLRSSVTLNLTFKAKNIDGRTFVALKPTTNRIAGTAIDRIFDLTNPVPKLVNIIVGDGGPTDIPSSGSADLSFQVRFQGIINTPAVTTIPVKVTIKKQQRLIDEKTIDFKYDTEATGDDKGRWLGSGLFDVPVRAPAGSGYSIFIKGPKHVQKKICDSDASEALGAEGTYRCTDKTLTIARDSSFDFSKVTLLTGDLPQQDGVVNSYDTSLVRNNLGKTDSDSLDKSDINLDGRVNTQDFSLIIYALSIRTDEE